MDRTGHIGRIQEVWQRRTFMGRGKTEWSLGQPLETVMRFCLVREVLLYANIKP